MCYLGWSQLFFQGRGEGDGDPIAQVYLVCEQQYVFSVTPSNSSLLILGTVTSHLASKLESEPQTENG